MRVTVRDLSRKLNKVSKVITNGLIERTSTMLADIAQNHVQRKKR